MKIDPNAPAMPLSIDDFVDADNHPAKGMTIRTKIAAMAMQGVIAAECPGNEFQDHQARARFSVACADALIAELNKEPYMEDK